MTTGTADASQPDVGLTAQPPERFAWSTLLVVVVGSFMITLDFFIINVAIPATQAELHATPADIQFIIAGFGLAYSAFMITGGRLGDLYGRRRLLAIGMVLFTVASAVCGFAPTAGVLIIARIAQGLGAAMISPQILAILNITFTGAQRTRAFTAFALSIGLGATFGQLIGGALTDLDIAGLSWRTVFLINVPIGLAALAAMRRAVPESRGGGAAGLDLFGTLLVSASLVALVLPLIEGREAGWPPWSWVLLIASVPLLAGFLVQQSRRERSGAAPLISLSLFRERAFSIGVLMNLLYFCSMASFFLVLALYLQEGHGLSAMAAGSVFCAVGFGYLIACSLADRFALRMGRQVLAVGGVLIAAGYGLVIATVAAIGTTGPIAWILIGLFVAGWGMGLALMPMTPLVLAGIEPDHAAAVAGVLSTAQKGGNALGVAIVGVVFFNLISSTGHAGFATAFQLSLAVLAIPVLLLAVLAQWLPRPRPAQRQVSGVSGGDASIRA